MDETRDTPRAIGDLLRMGVVDSVDLEAKRCVVKMGELLTGPIPFPAFRAGKTRIWSPPHVGEQVMLGCPEGDIARAAIIASYYTDQHPAPLAEDVLHVTFEDGAVLQYDPAGHELKIVLPAGGTLDVTAPGGATIHADVDINGDLQVSGDITATGEICADGDVLAGGVSGKHHTHGGVQSGSSSTGEPA